MLTIFHHRTINPRVDGYHMLEGIIVELSVNKSGVDDGDRSQLHILHEHLKKALCEGDLLKITVDGVNEREALATITDIANATDDAMARLMERMESLHGGGIDLLSTHPDSEERAERFDEAARDAAQYDDRERRDE